MATEIARGIIPVGFDPDQARKAGEEQLNPAFAGIAKNLAGAIGGAFAAVKIKDFIGGGLDELKQSIGVTAQTEAQLKATGGAAGVTAQQIDDLGQSMLDLAGFDDEAARSAANIFLRFDRIRGGELFKRIETDAADLAITMGTDLPAAAEVLGKALQDPDKAGRLLRNVFGQLTVAQQDAITSALRHGDIAAAQGVILDRLEATIGGTAKAYGDTLAGSQDKATESMKNAQAALTQGLAPAMQLGAKGVQLLADGIEALPGPLQTGIGGLVLLGASAASVSATVSNTINIFDKLRGAHTAGATAAQLGAAANIEFAASEGAVDIAAVGSTAHLAALDAAFAGEAVAAGGAAAATAGFVLAAAPYVAAVGAAVAVGYALWSQTGANITATEDFTRALQSQTGEIEHNTQLVLAGKLAHSDAAVAADAAGISFESQGKAVREGTDDFGAYARAAEEASHVNKITGDGTGDLVSKLKAAGAESTEFGRSLIAAAESGHLNANQLADLLVLIEGLHNGFTKATTDTANLDAAQVGLGVDMGTTAQQTAALASALQNSQTAQQANVDSARALFDANRQAEAADRGVESALRGQEDATRRVTDAQKALKEALKPADEGDLAKASLDISDAHLRVGDAAAAVRDAEAELERDRKDGRHTSAEIEDAQRKLAEAQNNYERAVLGVSDAEERQQTLQQKGTEQDQAVITARQNLATANQNLADQTYAVNDAMLRQADAQVGVLDAQERLNGGTLTANESLQNQLNIYGALETKLDPSNPLRQRLGALFNDLASLDFLFGLQAAQAANPNSPIGEGLGGFAVGGPLRPLQMFAGAEDGPELLWKSGVYQAPARGGYVSTAPETEAWLKDMWGGRPATGGEGGVGIRVEAGAIVVHNPAPEPASTSINRELAILSDKLALIS